MSREKVYRLREDNFKRALDHAEALLAEQFRKGRQALEMALREPKRSLDQNAKLWPMLGDVACQCTMVIDGEECTASREDWKDVFTAALKKHQRMAKGIDGGLVVLGQRTRDMGKPEFSDLLEIIYAYGSENGVRWSEKALAVYDEYREAA